MKIINVIHILKCDGLLPIQKRFLTELFHLKNPEDDFNLNRLLIDISFLTRIRRSFGNKPHELLIYYISKSKLNNLDTDFIKIINSIDQETEYNKLNKDEKYFKKIKNKREKNSIINAQNQFLKLIKPIVSNKKNKWCVTVTNLKIKFQVDDFYEKVKELNLLEKNNNNYYILNLKDDHLPYLKPTFHIYPNKVVLKIGSHGDSSIQASVSIVSSALFICHRYLNQTNQFWNFNLDIPPASEWLITIPYLYCITTNPEYIKFNGTVKDDNLGFELTECKGKYLRLKQNLPQIQIKPNQLGEFFNTYHPLKILDLEPQSFSKKQARNVTNSNSDVTSPFSNEEKKKGEITK